MVEQSQEYHPPQKRPKELPEGNKIREFKVVGDEPPRMHIKFNESTCPIQKYDVPKTDIQVSLTHVKTDQNVVFHPDCPVSQNIIMFWIDVACYLLMSSLTFT